MSRYEYRKSIKDKLRREFNKNKNILTKKCTSCKNEKLYKYFYFDFKQNNCCTSMCKVCTKKRVTNYRKKNKELINKKKREISKKKWALGLFTDEQKKERADQVRKWRIKNKEHLRKYNKNYKKKNKALCKSLALKRRSKLLSQKNTKKELEEIQEIFNLISFLESFTGEKLHLDHIIPLQNDKVCGLNSPRNMQILTYKENLFKSNKFDGTYDNESWRTHYDEFLNKEYE